MNPQIAWKNVFESETKPSYGLEEIVVDVNPENKVFKIDDKFSIFHVATASSATIHLPWKEFFQSVSLTQTEKFGLTEQPIDLLERSRRVKSILNPATESIKGFINKRNKGLVTNANEILDKLYHALTQHDISHINQLLPLRAYEKDEECISLEWIYSHWRIGFVLDRNQKDSSWFLVSDNTAGSIQASGDLASADFQWIVDWLIRRIH
jgi:hypothetical protein